MKKRLSIILLGCFLVISLTGCNVKFIEKVEPESTESSSENFGNIIIENTKTESSETIKNDTKEENTTEQNTTEQNNSSSVEQPTPNTENQQQSSKTEQPSTQKPGSFEYSGITFISLDATPTMYCKEDCSAKVNPSVAAKDYTSLKKGDFVTVKAVSEDERWAMVSVYGGPAAFIKYEYLTEEEVRVEQSLSELQPSTTESSSENTQTDSKTEDSNSQQTNQNTTSSQEPSSSYQQPSEPVDNYDGIPYPSNASSTSFNMGVEFADVNISLTIRKDGTQISNGPDRVSNSTGYYSLGTLNKGSTIKCTGIGRNGYVRVEYSGQVGFIDSKNVEY